MITEPLTDIEAWVNFFDAAELPVLRHTVHELDQFREDLDRVNARVLAGVILRDPLMTLRVLGYIESHRRQRQTTDITTIERALMMIGIEPFFRDFQDLPLVEDQLKPHPKALLGLLKVMARARKAAHWAREWAISRHDLDVDEITVAALLHDFTEILMWCFAPALAIKARESQLHDRSLRSLDVQTEIYGISPDALKSALATTLHLPALLSTLMANENSENARVKNVKLAINLARHAANGWDDAALPDDFRAIEELIHIGHDHLLQKLGLDLETLPASLRAAPATDASANPSADQPQ